MVLPLIAQPRIGAVAEDVLYFAADESELVRNGISFPHDQIQTLYEVVEAAFRRLGFHARHLFAHKLLAHADIAGVDEDAANPRLFDQILSDCLQRAISPVRSPEADFER